MHSLPRLGRRLDSLQSEQHEIVMSVLNVSHFRETIELIRRYASPETLEQFSPLFTPAPRRTSATPRSSMSATARAILEQSAASPYGPSHLQVGPAVGAPLGTPRQPVLPQQSMPPPLPQPNVTPLRSSAPAVPGLPPAPATPAGAAAARAAGQPAAATGMLVPRQQPRAAAGAPVAPTSPSGFFDRAVNWLVGEEPVKVVPQRCAHCNVVHRYVLPEEAARLAFRCSVCNQTNGVAEASSSSSSAAAHSAQLAGDDDGGDADADAVEDGAEQHAPAEAASAAPSRSPGPSKLRKRK